MRKQLSLLLLLLPAITGCLTHTRIVQKTRAADVVQNATLDQLVDRMNQQYDAIQTMTASVELAATTGGSHTGKVEVHTSLKGYIFLKKPEELRVLLQVPFIGSKALDMVSDGKTFKLLIPPRNRAVVGPNTVSSPSPNGLENLRPYVFFDSLLVKRLASDQVVSPTQGIHLIEPADKKKEPIEEPDYDLEILTQPRGRTIHTERVVHISRENLLPYQQDIFDEEGRVVTRANYSGYQKFGKVDFPTTIIITRPLDQYSLTLTVTKATFNEELAEDQFDLKIPDNIPVQHVK